MGKTLYTLSVCDMSKSRDSMRTIGMTSDLTMLYAILATKMKRGELGYKGGGNDTWKLFELDVKNGEVDLGLLEHGYVETFNEWQKGDELEGFPELSATYKGLTEAMAIGEIGRLGLDNHAAAFSEITVHSDYDSCQFYLPGVSDLEDIRQSEPYQELIRHEEQTEISITIYSYQVGTGERTPATKKELDVFLKYIELWDEVFEVDLFHDDHMSFDYQAEQKR